MVEGQLQIFEEYYDNQPTGLEVEARGAHEGADDARVRPWDPRDIRVTARNFSLRNIVDMVDSADLDLVPDFQRNEVWGPIQRSRLVESILLQIPLPAFYFVEDVDLTFQVVDGLQRLTTIYEFVHGATPFPLVKLEFLGKTLNGKRFRELEPALQRRIYNSQIQVNVIDPTTPRDVKYNIYKRINTGGTPLNLQEIRHCMAKPRSRAFLKSLVAMTEFKDASSGTRMAVRMGDRELALRYCAFRWFGPEKYRFYGSMENLLDAMSDELDNPVKISDAQMERLKEDLRRALTNCDTVFGKHAFRKWPLGNDKVNPFNRTLFETWSLALSDFATADVKARSERIAFAARKLMTEDQGYIQSITAATGDANKLEYRFKAALRIARDEQ